MRSLRPQPSTNFVAAPIEGAKAGIRLISSTTFGLGALLLGLGLAPRLPAGAWRTTALLAAAVGLWFVLLGVALFRGDGEAWADGGG